MALELDADHVLQVFSQIRVWFGQDVTRRKIVKQYHASDPNSYRLIDIQSYMETKKKERHARFRLWLQQLVAAWRAEQPPLTYLVPVVWDNHYTALVLGNHNDVRLFNPDTTGMYSQPPMHIIREVLGPETNIDLPHHPGAQQGKHDVFCAVYMAWYFASGYRDPGHTGATLEVIFDFMRMAVCQQFAHCTGWGTSGVSIRRSRGVRL
jgi:hypothetical protein